MKSEIRNSKSEIPESAKQPPPRKPSSLPEPLISKLGTQELRKEDVSDFGLRTSDFQNRRHFLRTALAASASIIALPTLIPSSALGRDGAVAPSERIVLAGIGIGRRGTSDLDVLLAEPDAQFVAVADIRDERRKAVKGIVDKHYGNQDCVTYRDFQELHERKDVDGLLIATGDRWHALMSILSAKAGKDMYCEKPCSMTMAESRALPDTMNRYGRVYQAGTQRRSVGNFIFAVQLARSGRLGKLHTVHANTLNPATNHTWLPAEPEPPRDQVDWDLWLGPCPWRPYNSKYVAGGWHNFFDFHGGGILEWGAHTVDLCQWAADADLTAPVEYAPTDDGCVALYASGVKLVMREKGWLGCGTCSVRFEGDEGWVETGDGGQILLSSESLRGRRKIGVEGVGRPAGHLRNYLDCIKSRGKPAANADIACQSHIACHAAYICCQLKRPLKLDPTKDEFIGDDDANRLRSRAQREPWRI